MAISAIDAYGAAGPVLANNGGTTLTVALDAGSIAINKGNNAFAPPAAGGDQRGLPFTRISPFGGTVDMGAFEVQTATPGNNPPTVANPIVDQSTIVGDFFSFTFPVNTFADPDGDVLTYSATLSDGGALPGWLTFDAVSRTFSGTPGPGDIAVNNIRLTATDGKGGSVFDEFVLTVTSNPPPVVSNAIPDQNATVSVPFTFTFAPNTFTDPNGSPLTFTATKSDGTPLPAWLSFNPGTRTFTGTPAVGDLGAYDSSRDRQRWPGQHGLRRFRHNGVKLGAAVQRKLRRTYRSTDHAEVAILRDYRNESGRRHAQATWPPGPRSTPDRWPPSTSLCQRRLRLFQP